MSQRVNKEKVKCAIATTGTVIATTLVVSSMLHSFLCTEEKPCFVCRKITAFKASRAVQKTLNEAADALEAESFAPTTDAAQAPTQTVAGRVTIGAVDLDSEMQNLENIDQ
ncbi:hypothetical protein SS50377_25824 [Spironucleus salmonicida]|uniref:Uncharacterized protein n=1 Tax=Spironucleus salmonicida TaxID=348837 RepID=V6LLJ5_9EUKA|nr:hypothetical protein SS50377_25824 [Spironucleus salmonicida]|eukprot:EST45417.1 Hypothetical protein SS50377_14649 [Spironucleus salmonicida]